MTLYRSFALSSVTSWTLSHLATRRCASRRHRHTLPPWLQQYTTEQSPVMQTSSVVRFELGTMLSAELFIVLTLRRLRGCMSDGGGCEHDRHNTLITLLYVLCRHLIFFVLNAAEISSWTRKPGPFQGHPKLLLVCSVTV
jgi:hypothetical protein